MFRFHSSWKWNIGLKWVKWNTINARSWFLRLFSQKSSIIDVGLGSKYAFELESGRNLRIPKLEFSKNRSFCIWKFAKFSKHFWRGSVTLLELITPALNKYLLFLDALIQVLLKHKWMLVLILLLNGICLPLFRNIPVELRIAWSWNWQHSSILYCKYERSLYKNN